MTSIGVFPPDEQSMAAHMSVPGTRVTPGAVSALDGPTVAGPEAAGALTLLYTAFADHDGAQRGYRNFAAIKHDFVARPGFLRWLTFNDGPHGYALGMWRTVEDVTAFVAGDAHRRMVRDQRERPFEYSQFAGVWVAHTIGRRSIYCPRCRHAAVTPTGGSCSACGEPLPDPFAA
jgi:heme-degrading monooxygenase HmoA